MCCLSSYLSNTKKGSNYNYNCWVLVAISMRFLYKFSHCLDDTLDYLKLIFFKADPRLKLSTLNSPLNHSLVIVCFHPFYQDYIVNLLDWLPPVVTTATSIFFYYHHPCLLFMLFYLCSLLQQNSNLLSNASNTCLFLWLYAILPLKVAWST